MVGYQVGQVRSATGTSTRSTICFVFYIFFLSFSGS